MRRRPRPVLHLRGVIRCYQMLDSLENLDADLDIVVVLATHTLGADPADALAAALVAALVDALAAAVADALAAAVAPAAAVALADDEINQKLLLYIEFLIRI